MPTYEVLKKSPDTSLPLLCFKPVMFSFTEPTLRGDEDNPVIKEVERIKITLAVLQSRSVLW